MFWIQFQKIGKRERIHQIFAIDEDALYEILRLFETSDMIKAYIVGQNSVILHCSRFGWAMDKWIQNWKEVTE